jgi:hypothetical protein
VSTEENAWGRILASFDSCGGGKSIGRAGCIPVYDGTKHTWSVFRNTQTIYPGVENVADPDKVDALRRNALSLLEHYPDTVLQLEKLGVRVKALLNRPITNYEDVVSWANSMFNLGPTSKYPVHVADTVDLMFDDYVLPIKQGRTAIYVIPANPRGSGVAATLDFSVPGSKTLFGPRHEYSKAAFAKQVVSPTPRYQGTTAEGEPRRPRGRPRNDGLMPGTLAAKRADERKRREREARRVEREARRVARIAAKEAGPPPPEASITKLPPRRRLVRVGQQAQTS